jgi:hypothetical protein
MDGTYVSAWPMVFDCSSWSLLETQGHLPSLANKDLLLGVPVMHKAPRRGGPELGLAAVTKQENGEHGV